MPDRGPHLGEALLGEPLGLRERRLGLVRVVVVEGQPRAAHVEQRHGQRVADHVVHLAGDPVAFLGAGPVRQPGLGLAQLREQRPLAPVEDAGGHGEHRAGDPRRPAGLVLLVDPLPHEHRHEHCTEHGGLACAERPAPSSRRSRTCRTSRRSTTARARARRRPAAATTSPDGEWPPGRRLRHASSPTSAITAPPTGTASAADCWHSTTPTTTKSATVAGATSRTLRGGHGRKPRSQRAVRRAARAEATTATRGPRSASRSRCRGRATARGSPG